MGAIVNFVKKIYSKGLTYPLQNGIIQKTKLTKVKQHPTKTANVNPSPVAIPRAAQENHIGGKGSIFTVFLSKKTDNTINVSGHKL